MYITLTTMQRGTLMFYRSILQFGRLKSPTKSIHKSNL